MNNNKYLFTSESVSEGHPDKVCDRISDMVVDSYLSKDPVSRVACETLTTTNKVVLAGEIRGPKIEKEELIQKVKDCIKDIGYDQEGFSWKTANIETFLHEQSSDIAMGVDSKDNKDEGAGDQGIMFGYACNETEELMPAPIHFSHKILRFMAEDRKNGTLKGIEPDSKSQVTMQYENDKPVKVTSVVISTQHSKDLNQEKVRDLIIPYIKKSIPENYLVNLDPKEIYINPTGQFIIGGPDGDTGLTGRKIIVDTYGGKGAHGGGAFSGKDPSKVDRSGAYATRHIAKNLVAAGLCDEVLVQVAYAIGVAKPMGIFIDTYGTSNLNMTDGEIAKEVEQIFDMRPYAIETRFKLRTPIYSESAAYGHMGRKTEVVEKTFTDGSGKSITLEVKLFPWEELDYVDKVKKTFGL